MTSKKAAATTQQKQAAPAAAPPPEKKPQGVYFDAPESTGSFLNGTNPALTRGRFLGG